MKVIEQYSAAKTGDEALNEDALVITPNFIAVIDGSSLAAHERFNGMTGGRFAAQTLAHGIRQLPANANAISAVETLTDSLNHAIAQSGKTPGKSLAAAGMTVFSRARNEIWTVADCPFMVDGHTHTTTLKPAVLRANIRQYMLEGLIEEGKAKGRTEAAMIADLLQNDPTPDLIKQGVMANSSIYANNSNAAFGYGVLNGTPIPHNHIQVVNVGQAREIVIASDGYPKIFNTLAKTETHLADVVRRDPLCFRENPQPKAVKSGRYYDDVTYVRFQPRATASTP